MTLKDFLSQKLPGVPFASAQAVISLAAEGATIPFIARYRKEKTGNLDEVQVRDVLEFNEAFDAIKKRQAFIIEEVEKQGQMTPELRQTVSQTWDLGLLEEVYRPYKKKKKTKATLAREAGLEPLADWLWGLGHGEVQDKTPIEVKAKEFLNVEKGFVTYEHCLKGAQEILVEKTQNLAEHRALVRKEMMENGKAVSKKGKKVKPHSKFEPYFEFEEKISSLRQPKNSHRYLALRRGWDEGELTVTLEIDEAKVLPTFQQFLQPAAGTQAEDFLKNTAQVAYKIHVLPSITNEVHTLMKAEADVQAIHVFSENVRRVLLASPFGSKWVLGVDPGLRTGCKIALVDSTGKYITDTVLKLQEANAEETAEKILKDLVDRIQAIAVGNGTGGREAQTFFRKVIEKMGAKTPVIMVNESGASVYSASEVAREEFPDMDLTVRGAVSIARRLQDPLAELVKIDPKSIGVGQYQHDVSQTNLKKALDFVVESCVNKVGVDVNTASEYLLRYISGIGPAVSKNIVQFRNEHGPFKNRMTLTKVPNFSTKTFEQAAGFLRLADSENPLDRTGIHPERYGAVSEMAKKVGVSIAKLVSPEGAQKLKSQRDEWKDLVGEFTFDDIVNELEKPGRDPRDPFQLFSYRDDIHEIKDLKKDMICPGIVTNVTSFGAFVDVGVHQDGLVHISEISNKFVSDPTQVLSPGDVVTVKVMGVNMEKNQISLSMKMEAPKERSERPEKREGQPRRSPRPDRKEAKGPQGQRDGDRGKDRGKDRPPRKGKPPQKGAGSDQKRDRNDRGGRRHEPLNNPFAALADLKSTLRKN